MAKTISIQPAELPNRTLPYPYHIDAKGMVGRQDFWRGKPYKLLGFSLTAKTGNMEIEFKKFWKNPKIAIGKFAVMADKEDNWYTYPDHIEGVHVNK